MRTTTAPKGKTSASAAPIICVARSSTASKVVVLAIENYPASFQIERSKQSQWRAAASIDAVESHGHQGSRCAASVVECRATCSRARLSVEQDELARLWRRLAEDRTSILRRKTPLWRPRRRRQPNWVRPMIRRCEHGLRDGALHKPRSCPV